MQGKNNKDIVQKASELWSTKDLKMVEELYAPNCVHHQQNQHQDVTFTGIDAWKKYIEDFLKKHPDYKEKIMSQIQEGDKVVTTLECVSSKTKWSGVVIDRVQNGKIQETWAWFKRK